MMPSKPKRYPTHLLRCVILTCFIAIAGVQAVYAIPNCKPGDTRPICICGKGKCTPPVTVKYGARSYAPSYLILSLLYAPPGAASNVAFNNTNTEGSTTGVSSGFGTGLSLATSATGGLFAQTSLGVTFTESGTTTNASTFTVTSTSSAGAQLTATKDAIDHTQDRFFLWLNALVTVTQTGPQTATYAIGTVNGAPMDVIDISLQEVKNPSLIPADKLGQQTIHGVTLPGLSILKPADFTAIASMDKVISLTTPPVDAKRYVYIESLPLEGPDTSGSDAVKNTYAISDATLTTTIQTETTNITTSLVMADKVEIPGVFTVSIGITGSLIWNYSNSEGGSSGTTNQATLTLGTSQTGCLEYVDVYSDTMFHTMAFTTPIPTCAPIKTRPGSSAIPPAILNGLLQDASGQPAPRQVVTLTLPNGTVRRIVTDSKGRYVLTRASTGTVKISALGVTSQVRIVAGKTAAAILKAN